MLNKIIIMLLATSWIQLSNTALAASTQKQGLKQSQLLHLQEAAIKFSKRLKQNSSDHVAIYNIAVISYRLQKYNDAEFYFRKLLNVKAYRMLSMYNLGLVANKQKNVQAAIKWFSKVIDATGLTKVIDKKVQKLAFRQRSKLSSNQITTKKKEDKQNKLKTYLLAKIGYNDRVEDTVGNIYTSDQFIKLYGLLTFKLDKLHPGFETRLKFYDKSYGIFSGFDYRFITVDAGKWFKQNKWKHLIRAGYNQSSFGDIDYLSGIHFEVHTLYQLDKSHKLLAAFRLDDYKSGDALYDVYEGSQQRLRLRYDLKLKPHKFRIQLEFEDNDRTDRVNAGIVQTSYSPRRNKLQLTWYYKLNKHWKGFLRFENRDSRYNDFSSTHGLVRDEQRQQTTLQVKYRFKKGWSWVSELKYRDNTSNIVEYDYNRTELSTGVSAYF